jgi:hypothetical protein
MTSDEIRQKQPWEISDNQWFREIALQLALLNEKRAPEPHRHPQKGK